MRPTGETPVPPKDHRLETCATGHQPVEHRLETCATPQVGNLCHRVLTVVEFLGAGEIEEWRSLREVAAGAGMPESACYRILETLTARSWVDKSPKGYRFGSLHLLGMLIYAQQYWLKKFENLGVKQ